MVYNAFLGLVCGLYLVWCIGLGLGVETVLICGFFFNPVFVGLFVVKLGLIEF